MLMIVIDEILRENGLLDAIATWYRGKVVAASSLEADTAGQGPTLNALLNKLQGATFVTLAQAGVWPTLRPQKGYCVVTVDLPENCLRDAPGLLEQLFQLPDFKSQDRRVGKVVLLKPAEVAFYQDDFEIHTLAWPQPVEIPEETPPIEAEAAGPPKYRMTDLLLSERPRERMANLGPKALASAELLAILLRVGMKGENAVQMGQRLLQDLGGIIGLHRTPWDELVAQPGMGTAKTAQIKAAIELGRRLTLEAPEERPAIHSPADAAALIQYEMIGFEQEHLRVILLDTRNRVLGMKDVYKGSLNSSQVRVGELFKWAIRRNAAALILAHNHPSGDPTPSPDDVAVTRVVVQAGKLLDIEVLDHLVIGQGRYVSLKERKLGF